MQITRKPTHPGTFFKSTVLDDRGISITAAAKHLGVTRKSLSEVVNGKTQCSVVMARRLSELLGTGASVWIRMQAKLNAWEASNMAMPKNVSKLPE
jgi:addiction module HigA family antidote